MPLRDWIESSKQDAPLLTSERAQQAIRLSTIGTVACRFTSWTSATTFDHSWQLVPIEVHV